MLDVRRVELKYLISRSQAAEAKARLSRILHEDPNNGLNGYVVRSLYFDTPDDLDFQEKIDGIDNRKKIRLRCYGPNSTVYKLELKEKSNGLQRKRSLSLDVREARQMMEGDYRVLLLREDPLGRWLYTYMVTHLYRPKVMVEYNRTAFINFACDTRITLDSDLRGSESCFDLSREDLFLYPTQPREQVVMEVKYNNFLFSYIGNVVSQVGGVMMSNSKYCHSRMVTKGGI